MNVNVVVNCECVCKLMVVNYFVNVYSFNETDFFVNVSNYFVNVPGKNPNKEVVKSISIEMSF